jgi:hypothetical protein
MYKLIVDGNQLQYELKYREEGVDWILYDQSKVLAEGKGFDDCVSAIKALAQYIKTIERKNTAPRYRPIAAA